MITTRRQGARGQVRRVIPARPALVELQAAAGAALEATGPDAAFATVLEEMCARTGWPAGGVWLPDAECARLRHGRIWRDDPRWDTRVFKGASESLVPVRGEDLPGRAFEGRRPRWARDLGTRAGPRADAARAAGVRAACALPACAGDRVIAVFELVARDAAEPDATLLRAMGQASGLVGRVLEHILADAARRAHMDLASALCDAAPDSMITIARDGRVLDANPRAEEMFGYRRSEIVGCDFADLLASSALRADCRRRLEAAAGAGRGSALDHRFDADALRRDGSQFAAEIVLRVVRPGREAVFAAYVCDITARKSVERRLRYEALHDDLTDLPNRRLFMDRMEHALARADRRGDPHSLIFVDLDDFKEINDRLGHASGDELLVEVGRRLQERLRPGDTVARLGGDEFAVLLEDTDSEGAARVARRVVEDLEAPLRVDDREVDVRASIGVATGSSGRTRADELLRRADEVMYDVKGRGKEGYAVSTDD